MDNTTFETTLDIIGFSNSSADDNEESSAKCQSYQDITLALLIYSIIVLALYALLQRRTNKYKEIFHGFLGVPVSVNLIHETKDRWIYALAFGALAGDFLEITLRGNYGDFLPSANTTGGNILKGILLLIIMMALPLLHFALFASIHGPLQIVSHIIGFVHVLLQFIQLTLSCSSCDKALDTLSPGIFRNTERAILYSRCIPVGICLVLIGAFFVWRGVQATVYLIIRKPFPPQQTVDHHIGHVKRLLNKPPQTVPSNRLFAIVKPHLYQWDPYFKFSVRIISTGVVIVLGLFLLTFRMVNLLIRIVDVVKGGLNNTEDLNENYSKAIVGVSNFFAVVFPFICFTITLIGYFTSLASYKHQCKLLWKGDRSFLPAKKSPTAQILSSSVHFFGFQVAMVIWAWILYAIILVLILSAIIAFIALLVLFDVVRDQVVIFTTSFIIGYIIYYTQLYFIKYIFVNKEEGQKKPSQNSTAHKDISHGEIVLFDNRRLFHLFTFFFIFYHMLIGLFKALRRVLISTFLNVFYLSRLDTPLTVKGWEFLDKAYVSYTAILKLDAAYNNPVMNVFVYLISNVTDPKSTRIKTYSSLPVSAIDKITVINYNSCNQSAPLIAEQNDNVIISRAKKRWHLAYTLVRNPDLIVLRRRDQDMYDNRDPTKDIGYFNPVANVNENVIELSMPVSEDDPTKL